MSGKYLVTRLATSGSVAPKRTLWWPQHSRLLSTAMDGRRVSTPPALRSKMLEDAREWEFASPSLARLVAEHVGLELSLIEGARTQDDQRILRTGDLLISNAEEQATLLSEKIREFPKAMFLKLLKEHIGLTVKALDFRMERDKEGMSACAKNRVTNTFRLAAFTTEWF